MQIHPDKPGGDAVLTKSLLEQSEKAVKAEELFPPEIVASKTASAARGVPLTRLSGLTRSGPLPGRPRSKPAFSSILSRSSRCRSRVWEFIWTTIRQSEVSTQEAPVDEPVVSSPDGGAHLPR